VNWNSPRKASFSFKHTKRSPIKSGYGDGLSAKERLAPVAIDATTVLSARERLAPVAVIGTDEGTDDETDDDG
jgi:hypothetical protein